MIDTAGKPSAMRAILELRTVYFVVVTFAPSLPRT